MLVISPEFKVHLLDLVDKTATPLTFLPTAFLPLWSTDEALVVYGDRRSSASETFTVASDGSSGAERLFAYVSDEEGSDQIYLRDLEALERRWRVTTEGGGSPVWSRDGQELYFAGGIRFSG